VRHFDERYPSGIERCGDLHHLLYGNLVALRMHAVAQAHVVQDNLAAVKIHVRLRSYQL
jgi:hypothetical protein